MELQLASNKLTIRDTSKETTVPDNPKAKLMYYLHCVSCVVRANQLEGFTNYKEYDSVPDSKIDYLLDLSRIFNPKKFVELGLFIIDDNLDMGNRFYEINEEKTKFHANEQIEIGEIKVQIIKIMRFKTAWVFKNYLDPLEELTRRDQKQVINSYRDANRVYQRKQDPVEEFKDCMCGCNIF